MNKKYFIQIDKYDIDRLANLLFLLENLALYQMIDSHEIEDCYILIDDILHQIEEQITQA